MRTVVAKPKAYLKKRVDEWLNKDVETYETIVPNDMEKLYKAIRKGDVVLIEGRVRLSQLIKVFTQSQWSHVVLYIGDELLKREPSRREELIEKYGDYADKLIVEALVEDGMVTNPLEKYRHLNMRIARPVNISDADLDLVLRNVLNDLGKQYDRRNILDLALQLLPLNFGLFKKKRVEICIGACSDFQVICSASIAKAFQSVGFLIRPVVEQAVTRGDGSGETSDGPVFKMQHPSRIVPRDFDLSPNFDIIKFLRSPEGGSAVMSKTPLVPISRVAVDRH